MLNVLFAIVLAGGIGLFIRNIKRLRRNIFLGKTTDTNTNTAYRLRRMLSLALGQRKMTIRPVAGILHIVVYVGFVIVNIEMIEIILDGLLGTHRILKSWGKFYQFLIAGFEILAVMVLVSVFVFWIRRNVLKINRFRKSELNGFAQKDANFILYLEAFLMVLFLLMNATDLQLQQQGIYPLTHNFLISQYITPLLSGVSPNMLIVIERACWWLHIIGILFFLNYLYYSKHLHILLAFPYTYFANVMPKGQMYNMKSVTTEVQLMLDPNANPFDTSVDNTASAEKFGVSDATDLNWVQILGAYTCTECGRCTDDCPANQTGKLLSPRKIMMNTRDRIEEIGRNIDKNGSWVDDGKQLLDHYITRQELWACTSCNACVTSCPIEINPLEIIIEMRRYLVMEQASVPTSLNMMMNNIENNGSPWAYNPSERMEVFNNR